jgi:hypothetical protein
VLGRAREGGREGKEKGVVMGCPIIGDAAGVGDGPWAAPHGDEAWGQRGGRASLRGR